MGVFGGTFDPIHLGHLVVAEDVADALHLDRLLFVPAGIPPHKPDHEPAPAKLRLEMVEAAVAEEPRFEASPIEVRREGPSYTVDTLRALTGELPGARLFFLMGSDQWRGFGSWRDPAGIARLAVLAVMARSRRAEELSSPELPPGCEPRVETVDVTRVEVSATEIRRRVRDGRSVRFRVPHGAHRIIVREGLYR